MQINLYTFKGEKNLVDKTNYISARKNDNGTTKSIFSNVVLKDNCSITAPVIIINLNGDKVNANYAYIKEFNRFYFIDDVISLNNNLWELRMSVDVLMTYKDGIKTLYGFVERQEFDFNTQIIDNKRAVKQGYKDVTLREFEIPDSYLFTYNANKENCFIVTGMAVEAFDDTSLTNSEET